MGEKLLNSTEAAIKLGITKELLFAYVRNAPKKGDDRKLQTTLIEGENYFKEKELEEFDDYLKEPWSNSAKDRPPIPKYIKEYLKVEIGGKCPITGRGYPLENAHIIDYSKSLNHYHHNLIRISRNLHRKFDGKVSSKQELRETKDRLVAELRSKLRSKTKKYNSTFRAPSPNSVFVGREEQLKELVESLKNDKFVLIQGVGGIGKTQLLVQALNKRKDDTKTIWFNIEKYHHLNDLELELSRALQGLVDPQKSLVDQLDKLEVCIIFDGLEKLQIAEPDKTIKFLRDLAQYTNSPQFIITSQIDLSTLDLTKTVLSLDGLSNEKSTFLIKEIIGEDYNFKEEELGMLSEFCEGHPLSLKLISALIKYYGKISSVKEHLQTQKDLIHPLRKKPDKSTSLQICLSTVYSSLSNDQRKLLKYFVCFPGGCKLLWIPPDIKAGSFERDIARLKQFFLIQEKEDLLEFQRAHLIAPIRKFVRDRGQKNGNGAINIQKEAITNLMVEALIVSFKYLEFNETEAPEYGLLRLECELPNLKEAFQISNWGIKHGKKYGESPDEYRRIKVAIASSLGKYFFTRGFFNHGIVFAKAGIKANTELEDYESVAQQYMYLAQIQMRQYNFDEFEETTKKLESLAENTKSDEINTKAKWCKGRLELQNRNFDLALNHFNKTRQLLEKEVSETFKEYKLRRTNTGNLTADELTKDDYIKSKRLSKGNLSNILSEIANVYESSGRFKEAINYYLKSLEESSDLGYQTNTPNIYHQLGNCYSSIGELEKAVEYYYKAINGFIRFGNYEYLGNSISELGRFAKDRPEIVNYPRLDEGILERVLGKLTYQIDGYIGRVESKLSTDEAIERLPWELMGKAMLIIQFMSFSQYSYLLYDWALNLNEKLGLEDLGLSYFTAIINVAHIVGGVGYGYHESDRRENMMKHLKRGVLILNGGPDLRSQTKIFYWLAAWMRFKDIDQDVEPEKLLEEAFKSFE